MTALDDAATMGRRAGEAFRDAGVVTRCPFPDNGTRSALRDAWLRAYAAVVYGPR